MNVQVILNEDLPNLGRQRRTLCQLVQVEQGVVEIIPLAKPLHKFEVRLFGDQRSRVDRDQQQPDWPCQQPGFHRLVLNFDEKRKR